MDDETGGGAGAAGSGAESGDLDGGNAEGGNAEGGEDPDAVAPPSPSTPTPEETTKCPYAGLGDVEVVTEVSGSNGAFVDHCDASGNLVTYVCARESEWVCNAWECYDSYYETEEVQETYVNCAGTCQGGRCVSKCPHTGDIVRYVALRPDGRHEIHNDTSGFSYGCEYLVCSAAPPPGTTAEISYYEAKHETCMGTETSAFAIGDCSFVCSAL